MEQADFDPMLGVLIKTIHQVQAHEVSAFSPSKAFQSSVFLEELISACHWKSHNSFTQFYLKDVTWADSKPFHS